MTLAVLFAASTVHAGVGFGTALVAMPLLVMIVGIDVAMPLVALAKVITIGLVLARDWCSIDLRAAWRLVLASTLGIPIGIELTRTAPPVWVKTGLGVLLVAYGAYCLLRPRLPALHSTRAGYAFGFAAGLLGGAYNTTGPPVVVYGALEQWSPARFRATLSGYFMPTSLIICAAHAVSGLWTRPVLGLFAWSLPALLAGNVCGALLARRIPRERFTRVLYVLLIVLGVLIFAQ